MQEEESSCTVCGEALDWCPDWALMSEAETEAWKAGRLRGLQVRKHKGQHFKRKA